MINKHQRKRQFIAWLLQHYRHANPTVNYFLEFLMVQPDYIQYVEFSDQVEYASHGVYISYVEQTAVPYVTIRKANPTVLVSRLSMT